MSKIQTLGAALFAALAFSVISAAGASANKWLCGGAACAGKESAVTEGTWTLKGLVIFGGELEAECNGKLLGTVGPGAEDEVTSATDLSGNKVLDCKILKNVGTPCTGTLVLVEAEHLPWKTELLEPKAGEMVDHFKSGGKGLPAFDVKCLLSGGSWTLELCEGEVLTKPLVNNATNKDVDATVLNQLSSKCNGFGNVSHVSAKGLVKLLSGATLSVS